MYVKVLNLLTTDQLFINVTPTSSIVGEGATAIFTATASGINNENFIYQWKKKGNGNLLIDVLEGNGTVLRIHNSIKSDEGQYCCNVTNEWGRSVKSNDVTLTVTGMYWLKLYACMYVCMYVHTYTRTHTHTHTLTHTHIHTHTHTHTHSHTHTHTHTHTCTHMHIHTYTHRRVCICVYVCIHTYAFM